jgi:hypothetical protein
MSVGRGKRLTKSEHSQRYKTPRQADIGAAVAQREKREMKPMKSFGRTDMTMILDESRYKGLVGELSYIRECFGLFQEPKHSFQFSICLVCEKPINWNGIFRLECVTQRGVVNNQSAF